MVVWLVNLPLNEIQGQVTTKQIQWNTLVLKIVKYLLWGYVRKQSQFLRIISYYFNPIQHGGQKAPPPTSFSAVTSTNVWFGPQNFLTFSFNPFVTLVQNFKFVPSASPKLSNLNHDRSSKKRFFWSNFYKIEVVITFFTEMLQLPNFGHMTTSVI